VKTLLLTTTISAAIIIVIVLSIPTQQTSRCQEGMLPNGTCAGPIWINSGNVSNVSIQETSYLYLFKKNKSLEDVPLAAYPQPLLRKVQNITGLKQPSFEQIHYTLSKEGVFNYTGKKIDSYGTVNIIVSSNIKKPDGRMLTTDDIMPNARFYYAPMTSATLVLSETGKYYVLSEDANSAYGLDKSNLITVIILPVDSSDAIKINSYYDQVRETIESYNPSVNHN